MTLMNAENKTFSYQKVLYKYGARKRCTNKHGTQKANNYQDVLCMPVRGAVCASAEIN